MKKKRRRRKNNDKGERKMGRKTEKYENTMSL